MIDILRDLAPDAPQVEIPPMDRRKAYHMHGEDNQGHDVSVTFALTDDHRIAVRRTALGTMLVTPRAVGRIIEVLRNMQADALCGETWPIDQGCH